MSSGVTYSSTTGGFIFFYDYCFWEVQLCGAHAEGVWWQVDVLTLSAWSRCTGSRSQSLALLCSLLVRRLHKRLHMQLSCAMLKRRALSQSAGTVAFTLLGNACNTNCWALVSSITVSISLPSAVRRCNSCIVEGYDPCQAACNTSKSCHEVLTSTSSVSTGQMLYVNSGACTF